MGRTGSIISLRGGRPTLAAFSSDTGASAFSASRNRAVGGMGSSGGFPDLQLEIDDLGA
jgi:hypothetical protein